jgi:hypothetical protein
MEVLLHSKPLSARNVESILLLEFSLPFVIEDSLYVIFSMTNTLQKNCNGMLFVQLNTLHKCAKTTCNLQF